MEFLLILSEDVELVATEEDHRRAQQRTGEYVMRLVGEGRMRGGGLLRPAGEARLNDAGNLVTLEHQDRTRWDRTLRRAWRPCPAAGCGG